MLELFLIGVIGGSLARAKKNADKVSASDIPTVPVANIHSSELAREWESRLKRMEPYRPPSMEESPYRKLFPKRG